MYGRQAFEFLLATVEFVLVYPALLRFYLQAFRAPARNPLSQFVIAVTDFAVRPLRKLIPGLQGLDLASLAWAWLAELLALLAFYALAGAVVIGNHVTLPALVFLALIKLVKFSLHLLIFTVLVQAILSWVSPYHAIMPVLDSLNRPFLRPASRLLPRVGNVDLSPLVIFVICQLLLILPVQALEGAAVRLIQFAS